MAAAYEGRERRAVRAEEEEMEDEREEGGIVE